MNSDPAVTFTPRGPAVVVKLIDLDSATEPDAVKIVKLPVGVLMNERRVARSIPRSIERLALPFQATRSMLPESTKRREPSGTSIGTSVVLLSTSWLNRMRSAPDSMVTVVPLIASMVESNWLISCSVVVPS